MTSPMRIARLLIGLACLAACMLARADDARIASAQQLFAQFMALEQAYDPALADLYAPEALVTIRRTFPMGNPSDTLYLGADYKTFLRALLPAAKTNGERNRYSKISFTLEGEQVLVAAARYSELKGRTSPISLLVGQSPQGKWLIYQELSESRQ